MDISLFIAQAPVAGYVTFGNMIAIVVSLLAVFVTVIGIMMLWIGNQLSTASKRREEISEKQTAQYTQTQKQLNNLMIMIATQKGLTVEEALKLIAATEK